MHSELRDAPKYLEFIAVGFLLCPSLLFHPEARYQEIFRQAATDQLVVTLYRDLVSEGGREEVIGTETRRFVSLPSKVPSCSVCCVLSRSVLLTAKLAVLLLF
jgi:hypothetical protein